MDAYVYKAALYCPKCAGRIKKELKKAGEVPEDPEDETSYDSDDYPKGPFAEGGGESDSPQHCDECSVFLENPLTSDGEEYVIQAVRENRAKRAKGKKTNPVIDEWETYYDYLDFGDEEDER